MKTLRLKLTKKQIYDIREFVSETYPEGCGKKFWLLAEPFITEFNEKLKIALLTEKEGYEINKVFKKL